MMTVPPDGGGPDAVQAPAVESVWATSRFVVGRIGLMIVLAPFWLSALWFILAIPTLVVQFLLPRQIEAVAGGVVFALGALVLVGGWIAGFVGEIRQRRRSPLEVSRPTVPVSPAPPPAPVVVEEPVPSVEVVRGTTPLRGFRRWIVLAGPGPSDAEPIPELAGAVWSLPWPGAELAAECRRMSGLTARHDPSSVPNEVCTCGIYALKDRRAVPASSGVIVDGAVELIGRVIEGEAGFRAQRARIAGPLTVRAICSATSPGSSARVRLLRPSCGRPARRVGSADGRFVAFCTAHESELAGHTWNLDEFADYAAGWLRARYEVEVRWEGAMR